MEAVDHECGECLRVDILCDDEERTSTFGCGLQDGEELLDAADFLVVDEDERVLHHALQFVGVGDEVAAQVTAVELHTLYHVDVCVTALALLNGDDAVFRHLAHGVGKQFAYFLVVVGTHGSHLLNLVVVVVHLLSHACDVVDHSGDGLVDTALQVHGVGTCGDVLQSLGNDRLCQHGSSGGAVAGIVAGLRGHALHELCASVLEAVFEFDFLGYGDTVLGNLGSTEFLLNHYVASLRAEGHLYCVGQLVDTLLEEVASLNIEFNVFCHDFVDF